MRASDEQPYQGQTPGQILLMIQRRYPHFHPLMALADIAHGVLPGLIGKSSTVPLVLRHDAVKTLAKYVAPQLKAVEHNITVDDQRTGVLKIMQPGSDDAWIQAAADARAALSDIQRQVEKADLDE